MLPRGSIYGREPHNHSRLLSLVVTPVTSISKSHARKRPSLLHLWLKGALSADDEKGKPEELTSKPNYGHKNTEPSDE